MCNTQPGHRSAFPTLGQSSARALLTAAIASVSGKEKHPQRLLAHASDAAYVEPQPCATLSQGIGQPFQRSARAALGVSLSNTRPKQRSGLAHPALASVSGPAAETKKKALSAWSHKPVELSASDPHSAHLTPRQVYHKIQLSRWGPEQPLPVQDGDRDVGHPGSILPSGGG